MRSEMPSSRGTEKPQMSASSTPTVLPVAGQRGGQVDGDRALADAALAAGDGEHAARRRDLRCRGRAARAFQRALSITSVRSSEFISPHVDAHVGDAGVDADARLDLALDVGAQRAAADRQLDADRDDAVVGSTIDRRHHAERHDVGAELGVDDRSRARRAPRHDSAVRRPVGAGSSRRLDVPIGRILPAPAV